MRARICPINPANVVRSFSQHPFRAKRGGSKYYDSHYKYQKYKQKYPIRTDIMIEIKKTFTYNELKKFQHRKKFACLNLAQNKIRVEK